MRFDHEAYLISGSLRGTYDKDVWIQQLIEFIRVILMIYDSNEITGKHVSGE